MHFPALWDAARRGQAGEVRRLLAAGEDVEERGGATLSSALHEAAAHGHLKTVLLLLEHGADVSGKTTAGDTPLFLAICQGCVANLSRSGLVAVAKVLVVHGADVSATNNAGITPLHVTSSEDAGVALLLFARGADVSATTLKGETPLHAAASSGDDEMVLPPSLPPSLSLSLPPSLLPSLLPSLPPSPSSPPTPGPLPGPLRPVT